jgi:GWxTD domain-containing protein
MKKIILLAILLAPFVTEAKNVWAFLTYSTFNSPQGPYIETYLTVAGNSVKYIKKENGKWQATINILMTFKQKDQIKAFKKYELNSPEIDDTTKNSYEFLDEQRFQVPNGTYDFEFQLSDKNNAGKGNPYLQTVTVDYPDGKPAISGIELVESYAKSESEKTITKSGYDLVPYVYNYYPAKDNRMIFYCELYNMDKTMGAGQKYIISYFIEGIENQLKLNDYARVKGELAKPVSVLLTEFNIENLPTGNYNIVVEARDQNNEVKTKQLLFFRRNNPNAQPSFADMFTNSSALSFVSKITNIDTLKEDISCTFPISSGLERSFMRSMLKSSNLQQLQDYFFSYWERRDKANPERAWLLYKEQVVKAQFNFGTPVKKGYQTDRGRVFLEYGPPNVRSTQYSEPSTYPYEIWQYYVLNQTQRNRKFVFYSPDMVTSDFFLLHSDANGEFNNPSWKIELQNRIYPGRDVGETQTINSWGNMAEDYWELPN